MKANTWVPLFFALAACSWMPHWSCHYYRLETASSFAVGSWAFSTTHSIMSLCIYSTLVALNLASVAFYQTRFISALLSGILHLTLASVHIARLINPFRFEVFGYQWPRGASLREVFMALAIGTACVVVAIIMLQNRNKQLR